MQVLVITPPARIVSVELAKQHLREYSDERDLLIATYIDAAIAQLDGPDGWLGRALGLQTLELQLDGFWSHDDHRRLVADRCLRDRLDFIALPYPPLVDVVSITYDDSAGDEQTLDPSAFDVAAEGVLPIQNTAWPAVSGRPGCVRIRYRAGYALDPDAQPPVNEIPPNAVGAILLMVGDAYENGGTTDVGRVAQIPMSMTVENQLSPLRVWA